MQGCCVSNWVVVSPSRPFFLFIRKKNLTLGGEHTSQIKCYKEKSTILLWAFYLSFPAEGMRMSRSES